MASHPKFGFDTTAFEVADVFPDAIKGRTIIVTGVSHGGIGGATVKALAAHSPRLLICSGRNPDKVNAVIDELQETYPDVKYRFLNMDLSSQASVRNAAAEILGDDDVEAIDILINNAGVMDIQERTLSPDGIEMQFATNHIGPFLFTNLVMPKLISAAAKTSPPSANTRIINVSSLAYVFGPVRFSDYNFSKPLDQIPEAEWPQMDRLRQLGALEDNPAPYIPFAAYAQSKTASILYSLSLTAKLATKYNIISFALHPGSISTELQRNSDPQKLADLRRRSGGMRIKTLESGASTTLVAALDPTLKAANVKDGSGLYLDNCQKGTLEPWAKDPEAAEKLWRLSEELVGQKFDF
jgi:NAD(P)-dependent dehydrogenase (short-subunit alcohol dehydrogenase family)